MDRHRMDRRRQPQRGGVRSVWLSLFAAVLVLYMVFVVKVQYYASSSTTTANAIGTVSDASIKSQPMGEGREMLEDKAPEPALAKAAVPVTKAPLPATTPPGIRVGAMTKKPTPTTPKPTKAPVPSEETRPTAPVPEVRGKLTVEPPATAAPVVAEDHAKMPVDHPLFATPQPPSTTPPVLPPPTAAVVQERKDPLADRHVILHGYKQTNNFLATYKKVPGENLFLFFTCSDKHFNAGDWSAECVSARETIHRVFAKAPPGSRLVTIYAGTEEFWNFQNKFRNDRDLRVKTVPCLMKWHANGGETSGMMIGDTLSEDPFLRYLFKNDDEPDRFLNAAAMVDTKSIETVSTYEAYQAKLTQYKLEPKPRRPLFLMFVSGRIAENNRPWCPYCRFSELPLEYGFYAFAPPHARLLRVEVSQTYQAWKTPNSYNRDPALGPLRGVPGFFTVKQLASQELRMDRIYERFDQLATLKTLFQTAALVQDEY